jgi:hypothetical protein
MSSLYRWLRDVSDLFAWKRHPVEQLVRELDEGLHDAVLLAEAGEQAPAAPEPYADVKPFDYQRWARSKGIEPG